MAVEHPTYGVGMVEDVLGHACIVNFMDYGLINVYKKNLSKVPFKKPDNKMREHHGISSERNNS